MKNFFMALLGGLLIVLFIVAVTAIGISYPVPDNYIVGYPPDHRQ